MAKSFGNVKTDEGSVFLEPGIHEVVIEKVEYVEEAGKKPYIGVTMANEAGSTTQKLYMSPQAEEQSLINIKHLFNKCVSNEQIEKINWPDNDNAPLADALHKLCAGKKIRIKLSGEEYNKRINAKFNWRPFAEAIGTKPEDSKLKFDPAVDIKREEKADISSTLSQPGTELPTQEQPSDLSFDQSGPEMPQ